MDDVVTQKLRADLDEATKQHMPAMVVTTDYLRATLDRIQALETSLAEARRQALEEAAKVADQWARSNYSEECNTMAGAIATDIRALASDPLLDRDSPSPPPVV